MHGDVYYLAEHEIKSDTTRHEGEEIGYVLEGMLEPTVHRRAYLLAAGDAFTFRSDLDHGFRNPGQSTTCVLWGNTPPTF